MLWLAATYDGRLGAEWLAAFAPLDTDEHKPHLTDAPFLIVVFAQRYYLDESVGIAVGVLEQVLVHA